MIRLHQMARLGASAPLSTLESLEARREHDAGHFEGRNGYDSSFLDSFPIALPGSANESDWVAGRDGKPAVLDYRNFSLVMSRSRRLAVFTACNIDGHGSEKNKIKRGRDAWYYDLRIDRKHQIGEELYEGNDLDRGHLVRREDPVWGEHAAEANDDTFHFTNCSPQYNLVNQQIWLGLENYILRNARLHRLQATVFTGPVFRDTDPVYRGVMIPREFWKVVAIVTDGRPSATAYLVSQEKYLDALEFAFGRYKTFQVGIREIERLTGLRFDQLAEHDGFSGEEAATGAPVRTELTSFEAIRV
ncbi:MAG: DNA/RNA non-specific endonuclease [Candidatus Didemnitutus sp.]|nr:DNA/RNA non-specific endonuclease [Candidatus Didemnitutus sp.]